MFLGFYISCAFRWIKAPRASRRENMVVYSINIKECAREGSHHRGIRDTSYIRRRHPVYIPRCTCSVREYMGERCCTHTLTHTQNHWGERKRRDRKAKGRPVPYMASEGFFLRAKTPKTSISCRFLANEMELDVAEIFLDSLSRCGRIGYISLAATRERHSRGPASLWYESVNCVPLAVRARASPAWCWLFLFFFCFFSKEQLWNTTTARNGGWAKGDAYADSIL